MQDTESGILRDARGNTASLEHFGSREQAQKALDSLKNCSDCSDCSGCSRCSRCSRCSGCSDCSDCSGCSGCSRCSDCSDCSDCSRCSRCSGCSDCSDCSGCSGCSPQPIKEKLHVPAIPNIHQTVYEAASSPRALNMSSFHTCETTHCRAGWVVTLAGEAGKKLEDFYNSELAAMLIYRQSGYPINPGRFYDSDQDALADMKRLAEEEAASQAAN